MNVKLVSITNPVIEGIDNPEELIVYCARVSNPNNQMNKETAPGLIKYLIKHKHWSPLEMVDVCVEIKTSRAIAQQIIRHRSFSFQEFSQRYSKAINLEPIQMRIQAEKNRQSSTDDFQDLDLLGKVNDYVEKGQKLYDELIENNVAKECARMVLPLTTETTIYMKGSLRSWIHYLQLRCDETTQKEHRDIANEVKEIIKPHFPNVIKAIKKL